MNVVFLDIDGVLNSYRSAVVKIGYTELDERCSKLMDIMHQDGVFSLTYSIKNSLRMVDPVCVALMNKVLEEPNVVLVLSSSHRKFFTGTATPFGSEPHLQRLKVYLETLGIKVPAMFDVTSDDHGPRGDQIRKWLDHEAKLKFPHVVIEQHVVIDDVESGFDGLTFIETDPAHGFSYDNYSQVTQTFWGKSAGLVLL